VKFLSDGIKSAFTIQAINSFVIGAMTIVIPLLMIERGIAVESMGLIFAVLPVISQTARVNFAIISDFIGRKIFYKLNSILNIIFMGIYYFAHSPIEFLFGKFAEGVRDASLWSVNRAYLMDYSYEKKNTLIKLRGFSAIFSAFGTMASGLFIALLFYENTILVCMLLSLLVIPYLFNLKDKMRRKVSITSILKSLDVRGRKRVFKNFMIIFFFTGLGWGLISGYIFPLFLRLMGYNEQYVGLILGVRTLCLGIIAYFLALKFSGKKLVLLGGIFFSISLALLSFSASSTAFIFIIITGLAEGLIAASFETIFVKIVNHNSSAGDIGILMFGLHVGTSASLAVSGFIISSIGFAPMFFVSAVLFAFSSLSSYYTLYG